MDLCLGIDPGLANTGWSLVSRSEHGLFDVAASGCIHTDKMDTESERLHQIYQEISDLLVKYLPTTLIVENVYFNRNTISCLSTSAVAGVCMVAGEVAGVAVESVSPQQAKKAVTGRGKASKESVIASVAKLTGLKVKATHEADAIAIAITGLMQMKYPRKLRIR